MSKLCTYTFLTVLTVDLLATAGDLALTWTSPVLPKLYSEDPTINPIGATITKDEESWIGSLINIGALLGPLPFGFLSTKFGRKITLLAIAVPYFASFIILSFLHNVYWYYFARFFSGVSIGAGYCVLPLYVAEVAEDSNRGMLTVTMNIFWTLGNLIPYLLGPYMPIVWFNITLASIPGLFFILFLIIGPESPYYLIGKNQIDKAEDALIKLRSRSKSEVGKEIIQIQDSLSKTETGGFTDLFKSKANIKALVISLLLISFQQLSGINAVLFYTQLIFEESGSELPPEISSIIIGVVLFLSSMIIPFFADSFGRKVFLTISAAGMMTFLFLLGTYCFFKENLSADVSAFQWLPIVTLIFFIVSYNLGFGSIPWTVSSELFAVNVKPIGISLVSLICWLGSFIITKFFNDLNELMGKAGTFWLFSGFCLTATLFTIIFVPETRGKSFNEIQAILAK